MRVRVLDLDGSITAQDRMLGKFRPEVHDLRRWGPAVRLACRWSRFHRFERWLDRALGRQDADDPSISFLGSGDFHHLTLALLRRLQQPVNLLVIDKHPDWMQKVPFLHCGTWLAHAARLPNVKRIFHVGGASGFDNALRWLAPKQLLRNGKIVVLPAVRCFQKGFWRSLPQKSLRTSVESPIQREDLEEMLWPYFAELERWPLYVTLDKDAMWMPESIANRGSGYLDLGEVQEILDFFMKSAGNELIGMDVVGDWSPVRLQGIFRSILARWEHPTRMVDANQARLCNERTNMMLLRFLLQEPASRRELVAA